MHGLGLESVNAVVDKYHGVMNVSNSNDMFTVSLVIFSFNLPKKFSIADTVSFSRHFVQYCVLIVNVDIPNVGIANLWSEWNNGFALAAAFDKTIKHFSLICCNLT